MSQLLPFSTFNAAGAKIGPSSPAPSRSAHSGSDGFESHLSAARRDSSSERNQPAQRPAAKPHERSGPRPVSQRPVHGRDVDEKPGAVAQHEERPGEKQVDATGKKSGSTPGIVESSEGKESDSSNPEAKDSGAGAKNPGQSADLLTQAQLATQTTPAVPPPAETPEQPASGGTPVSPVPGVTAGAGNDVPAAAAKEGEKADPSAADPAAADQSDASPPKEMAAREGRHHPKKAPVSAASLAIRGSYPVAAMKQAGTAAAEQPSSMKSAPEMNHFAGHAMQNVPGDGFGREGASGKEVASVDEAQKPVLSEGISNVASTATASTSRPSDPLPETVTETIRSSAGDAVAKAIHDGVAQLRRTGDDSLAVVIKPNQGTELILHVELKDGTAHAHVDCRQGSPIADTDWMHLQQRLAEQGVKLTRSDTPAPSGGNAGSFHQQTPQRRQSTSNNFEPALAHQGPGASNQNARTNARNRTSGFESWA